MEFPVLDINGKKVSSVDLPDEIFGIPKEEINTGLMHQLYVLQTSNARLGTHNTLTRGEVAMTTAKWYRQKGTGRARHGAQSAPHFVGGGQAHGPRPHKYTKNMPKQMRRIAIRNALSALVADEQLVVVDRFEASSPKTKDMAQTLNALVGGHKTLVLLADRNENVERGISNLADARYLRASYLNIRDLLSYDKVIVPLDALEVIKSIWGN
jgi:large subunit ribosomal protein L4